MKKSYNKKNTLFIFLILLFPGIIIAQPGGAIFTPGPAMLRGMIFPTACYLGNEKVITFSGRETGFISCSYSQLYDAATNTFSESVMNYPHDGSATVKLIDGRYLLLGGGQNSGIAPGYSNTEMYNPSTSTFDIKASMTMARMQHGAVQLKNGKVLVVGAWYNNAGAATGEIYDTSSNTFVATSGSLNQPRSQPLVFPTNDSGAVIAGGWPSFGGNIFTSVEYYQPATNDFITQSSELIPSDPGWLLNPIYTRTIEDCKMGNGNYIMLASRNGAGGGEYALIQFNPATKLFSKMNTQQPLKDSLTDGGFFDVVLNKAGNNAYLIGVDSASDPNKISVVSVSLSSGLIIHPTTSYTMPASEYFYASYTYLPIQEKILVQGINSTNTSYFDGTNKTYLLSPYITIDTKNLNNETNQVNCYPNPVKNNITITLNNAIVSTNDIKIYNTLGQQVYNNINATTKNNTIDVSSLTDGVYFLQFTINHIQYNKKIVIQH